MTEPARRDMDFLSRLGGPDQAAAAFRVSDGAIRMWRSRGRIPPEYHCVAWQIALEREIDWEPPQARFIRPLIATAAIAA